MAGLLINGQWKTKNEFADDDGKFKRDDAQFRGWLSADGSSGLDGQQGFPAESGRYHLYVSYACPWAHRTLIFRHLKDLEDHIDVSVVHPYMGDNGWQFGQDFHGATGDRLYDSKALHEVYTKAKKDYTGKVTVPVLWDKKEETIVSNESADIIRMFNSAFDGITGNTSDFYPEELREEIDAINKRVYDNVNNGVYKAGFATDQKAHSDAVIDLFDTLEWLEGMLADGRQYLLGENLTEADIRLLTTLLRFDAVYHTHFKCNIRPLSDYKFLQPYMEALYMEESVKPSVYMDHIKTHYYTSHPSVNPSGIVPVGPQMLWYDDDAPRAQ